MENKKRRMDSDVEFTYFFFQNLKEGKHSFFKMTNKHHDKRTFCQTEQHKKVIYIAPMSIQ